MASTWTSHPRIASARRRWPAANALVHAIERFQIHRTGRNSALVAHYGFLSVFPLMLVFTTVLGFLLEDNPTLREDIIDSAIARIPIIGPQVATNPAELEGSVPVLVFGLLTVLWAGLRAFNVLQMALDDIADVPLDERPNIFMIRVRSLLGILIIGGSQVAATVLSTYAGVSGIQLLSRLLLFLGAMVLNAAVLAATYHYLCSRHPSWRTVAPGAIIGGFVFAVLQIIGTTLVSRAIVKATPVYGTFASVIGLMMWLSLHAIVALLGAELNGVLPMHRMARPDTTTPDE